MQAGVPAHQERVAFDHFEYPVQDGLLDAAAERTSVRYLEGEQGVVRIGGTRAVVRVRQRDQNRLVPGHGVAPDPPAPPAAVERLERKALLSVLLGGVQAQRAGIKRHIAKLGEACAHYGSPSARS